MSIVPPIAALHPRGPTGTSHAPLRQPLGGRFAACGSLLWTPRMNRYHNLGGVNFECRQGVTSGCRLTLFGMGRVFAAYQEYSGNRQPLIYRTMAEAHAALEMRDPDFQPMSSADKATPPASTG